VGRQYFHGDQRGLGRLGRLGRVCSLARQHELQRVPRHPGERRKLIVTVPSIAPSDPNLRTFLMEAQARTISVSPRRGSNGTAPQTSCESPTKKRRVASAGGRRYLLQLRTNQRPAQRAMLPPRSPFLPQVSTVLKCAETLSLKPIHSSRSNIMGSTDSARRAGIQAAISPSDNIARTTPVTTSGSRGVA
jgi:hypothetical protein